MKRVDTRIKKILPDTALIGTNWFYRVSYDYEDLFFVSPAVFELLHDPESRNTVMKSLIQIDIKKLVREEMNNIFVTGRIIE